jgi:hypothetical protein
VSLTKRVIDIPLGVGLAENVDKDLVPGERLAAVDVVRLDKAGVYRKARGNAPLPGTATLPIGPNQNRLFAHKDRPVLLGDAGAYVYNESAETWRPSYDAGAVPVALDVFERVGSSDTINNLTSSIIGDVQCDVWDTVGTVTNCWVLLRDANTGAIVSPPQQLTGMASHPLVLRDSDTGFWRVFGIADGGTSLVTYQVTTSGVLTQDPAVGGTSGLTAFDFVPYLDGFRGLLVRSRLLYFASYTPGGGWVITQPLTRSADRVSVLYDAIASRLVLGWLYATGTQTTITLYTASLDFVSLVAIPAGLASLDTSSEQAVLGMVKRSTDTYWVVYGWKSTQGAASKWVLLNVDGTAESDETDLPNLCPVGRPFFPKPGVIPVVPMGFVRNGAGVLLLQADEYYGGKGGLVTYSGDPLVVARLHVFRTSFNGQTLLPYALGLSGVGSVKWRLPCFVANGTSFSSTVTRLRSTAIGGIYSDLVSSQAGDKTSVELVDLDFSPPPIPAVELGDLTLVGGEMPRTFDGTTLAESTLHWLTEAEAFSPATGSVFAGTVAFTKDYADDNGYTWPLQMRTAACFVVVDTQGYVHRSAPSVPQSLTLGAPVPPSDSTTYEPTWSVRPPPPTAFRLQVGQELRVQFFASDFALEGEGPMHLIADVAWSEIETAGGAWAWTAGQPDIRAYTQHEVLYTDGNVLEAHPPPMFRDIAVTPRRIFGVSSERPTEVWYSKILESLVAPEFNGTLLLQMSPRDELVACAAMDEKVILFTRDSVLFVAGSGPDNTGRGAYPPPQVIPSDTGCVNRRSVVEMPQGVMFLGKRGMMLVDRALQVSYVGGPVEELTKTTINSSVLIAEEQEVRFLTEDAIITYHYQAQQWTSRTWNKSYHSARIGGRHHFLTLGDGAGAVEVVRENDEASRDYSVRAGTQVQSVTTGWLTPSGVQGAVRTWRVLLVGRVVGRDYNGPVLPGDPPVGLQSYGDIRVEIGYDRDEDFPQSQDYIINLDTLVEKRFEIYLHPERQRCQAFRLRISEIGNTSTPGFVLSGLTVELGVRPQRGRRTGTRL